MIIDTSAVLAILRAEEDAEIYAHAIDELIDEAGFIIEPVTERQARLARQAHVDFGKGSGHAAGLNFGDCLSYALAVDVREPLLWKGDDFGHTARGSTT